MISTFFSQFRHQYANGSLTTELLMTHAEQYLVKATVTIGDQVIATALAADTTLTVADDDAKVRVLAMLGFSDLADQDTKTQPLNELEHIQPAATPLNELEHIQPAATPLNELEHIQPAATPLNESEHIQPAATPPVESEAIALEYADADDIGRPISNIAPDEAPAPFEVPASTLAAAALENFDNSSPMDLSDIIAQTDVEMTRLGWSNLQGRQYLEKTFNKRSRQQLTDEELLTFLLHLESQGTPSVG